MRKRTQFIKNDTVSLLLFDMYLRDQISFDSLQTNAQTRFEIQLFQMKKKILNVCSIENSCLIIQKTTNLPRI